MEVTRLANMMRVGIVRAQNIRKSNNVVLSCTPTDASNSPFVSFCENENKDVTICTRIRYLSRLNQRSHLLDRRSPVKSVDAAIQLFRRLSNIAQAPGTGVREALPCRRHGRRRGFLLEAVDLHAVTVAVQVFKGLFGCRFLQSRFGGCRLFLQLVELSNPILHLLHLFGVRSSQRSATTSTAKTAAVGAPCGKPCGLDVGKCGVLGSVTLYVCLCRISSGFSAILGNETVARS
jgi:hypothetical protein